MQSSFGTLKNNSLSALHEIRHPTLRHDSLQACAVGIYDVSRAHGTICRLPQTDDHKDSGDNWLDHHYSS